MLWATCVNYCCKALKNCRIWSLRGNRFKIKVVNCDVAPLPDQKEQNRPQKLKFRLD